MTEPSPTLAETDLKKLYAPPSEQIRKGVVSALRSFQVAHLAKATFFTASPPAATSGRMPRRAAGRPASSMCWTRGRWLLLFPGLDIFMRINGRGAVVDDPELRAVLAEGAKTPKTATVVVVEEVFFH